MNAITTPQAVTMCSREIAELTGKRHDHVLRDIEGMLSQLGQTSPQFWGELPDGYQRQQRVAYLPKDLTITLVAGYNVQMRHAIVCRWQELEAQQAPKLPQTMAQALRLAAEQAEQIEAQQEQLALAAPKVEFVERYVQPGTGSMGLRQVCKLLGTKQNELTDFLLQRGLMYRTTPVSPLTPRAEHIHNGRFEAKTGTAEHGDTSHAYVHYKFTPKGVEWIAGLWGQHKAKLAQEGGAA